MAKPTLKERLQTGQPVWLMLFTIIATFCTYTCMFAFRKPFAAATFSDGPLLMGLDYKTALIIAQVLGYMLSKFIGVKVVSEMKGSYRALAILLLLAIAELALLGFGLSPAPINVFFLFLNGIPLGMIWGLVFSFVEGRKLTEVMGLALCASFIFASGFVKDIGRIVMGWGVSEYWMPFVTGLLFVIPLVFFVWMLHQIPPPNEEDQQLRTQREPMDGPSRWAYFKRFAPGLILLVAAYTLLSAYRDFRDNFLADIWEELTGPGIEVNFSATETPISIGVLVLLMLIVLVKDNLKALLVNHLAILAGLLLAGISTYGHQQGWVGDYSWIILTGFGTYIAYIPFNSILFDRMIATFRYVGNVGFLIYLADSFGYMGTVSVMLYKNFGAADLSWVQFFTNISYLLAAMGGIALICSTLYFSWKYKVWQQVAKKD